MDLVCIFLVAFIESIQRNRINLHNRSNNDIASILEYGPNLHIKRKFLRLLEATLFIIDILEIYLSENLKWLYENESIVFYL